MIAYAIRFINYSARECGMVGQGGQARNEGGQATATRIAREHRPRGLRVRFARHELGPTTASETLTQTMTAAKRVAADHYVYALTDYREVDRSVALARAVSVT